jgi:tetratricopeptide (TPR) repeat protein
MQTLKVSKNMFSLMIAATLICLASMLNPGCAPPAPSVGISKRMTNPDSLIEKNLAGFRQNIQNEFEIGLQYYSNDQFPEAIRHFQKAIQLDTIQYHQKVWSKLVDSYRKLELADSAFIFCQKGLAQHPRNIELLAHGANLHEELGHQDEAIQFYQKLVKLVPHSSEYWKKIARLYAEKDAEAALQAYEIVLTLNSEDTTSKGAQAKLLSRTGDTSPALERLLRIKRQNPGQSQPVFELGRLYFLKGAYPNAETEFREYLKTEPADEIGREYLAASFQNQNKFDAAINVYLTILQTNPQHIKSLCEIASCLKKLEKFDQARDYAMQAQTLEPEYGLSYIILGEIYQKVADNCLKARERMIPDWDDKLIYQMAYNQYKKALSDSLFKSIAEIRLQTVKRLIPTKEDWFMHPDDIRAKLKCYEWIYQ